MAQETYVAKVPKEAFETLENHIARGPFAFRSAQHAVFSVKGEGVVATLYSSGKFVVQGADPRAFVARWTDLEPGASAPSPNSGSDDPPIELDPPITGSDEAGKGDYFGPLVVAAVRADDAGLVRLQELGVVDSKRLSDNRTLALGALVRAECAFAIRRVDPSEYNRIYPNYPALNSLLADLHAEVLGRLAKRGENVLVDQFERRGHLRSATHSLGVELTEVPRAERHPCVAAASILARQEFLLGLGELSEAFGVPLHKGAGAPVDEIGAGLVRSQGIDALAVAAKLHFKNTDKILARV